jgi:hypothetical protein
MKRKLTRTGIFLALAILVAGFGGIERAFAPKAELWARWTGFDENSSLVVDHGDWDDFLRKYAKTDEAGYNLVAYGKVTAADRRVLNTYIARLADRPVDRLARPEQLAYWINLYNALTIQVILDHYPVASIRDIDISPGLFSDGPWDRKLIEVSSQPVSLNDIEHRILRPIWRDPRLHYTLNCAALGCPNLPPRAFNARESDAMMTQAAKAYINSPRGARRIGDQLIVSSIYDWYIADFGGDEAGIVEHLRRYAEPALLKILEDPGPLDSDYDWALNEARD